MGQTWDSQVSVGYYRFQIVCLFAEYDLFQLTTFIQNFTYIDFRIDLAQFYIKFLVTETSDRCLICIVQRLRFSVFSLYALSFSLYSPFNDKKIFEKCLKIMFYLHPYLAPPPSLFYVNCTLCWWRDKPGNKVCADQYEQKGTAEIIKIFVFIGWN